MKPLLLSLAIATAVTACATATSPTGRSQQVGAVSQEQLNQMGAEAFAQAKAQNRLYHEVVDGYFARHRVKPGVTGWAQINGWRGETDTDEKIKGRTEFDLYYIENWSLWFDLKILLLTPVRLLNTENAY